MTGLSIIETKDLIELRQDLAEMKEIFLKIATKAKQEDPLLTIQELQEYLKKGASWVDQNKHKIGCSRVGGEWRFRKSIVDEYINKTYHKDS